MRNEIKEEIQAIAAPVAAIGNANCYRVPDNYFEDLADEITSKIQLPATRSPFIAPTPAYFEGIADSILHKIKSNGTIVEAESELDRELMEFSPILASIPKTNVYAVPAGYFTEFKVAIPTVADDKKGKVVAMRQPVRWMRYAAAAVVAGVIAVGGIALFNNSRTTDGGDTIQGGFAKNITAALSSVSDDAIANYISSSPTDMDILPAGYDENKVDAGSLTEQLLEDVSDAAIQEYIKENQQPGDKGTKGI